MFGQIFDKSEHENHHNNDEVTKSSQMEMVLVLVKRKNLGRTTQLHVPVFDVKCVK